MAPLSTTRGKMQEVALHDKLNDFTVMCTDNLGMSDVKQIVGDRLRALREGRGLKLREVAAAVPGMSPSRLNNYEAGGRLPGVVEIKALAEFYGVSAAWLYTLTEDNAVEIGERFRQAYESATPGIQNIMRAHLEAIEQQIALVNPQKYLGQNRT